MNRTSGSQRRLLAVSAIALALSACGGNDDGPTTPKVTVDELGTGRYTVSLGDSIAPTVGRYYAAADGGRLLIVTDANDRTQQLYRRAAGAAWVAVPANDNELTVTLLRSDAATTTTVAPATLAGNYVTLVSTGVTANFTVTAAGDIVSGASSCKLSGKVAAGTLPNTLAVNLTSSACGTLPTSSSGVATVESEDAPAKFRILTDDGKQLVDLWAFAE